MKDKAEFKTGAFGIEFVDENKAANQDSAVLPRMVNAKVAGKGGAEEQLR